MVKKNEKQKKVERTRNKQASVFTYSDNLELQLGLKYQLNIDDCSKLYEC